jgi:hypothetical protein
MNLAFKLRKPLDKSVSVLSSLLQSVKEELHLRRGIFPTNVPVLGADLPEMICMDKLVSHRSDPT